MDEILGFISDDISRLFPTPEVNTSIAYVFFDTNLNTISYTFNKDRVQGNFIEVDINTIQIPINVYVKKFYVSNGTILEDVNLLLDYIKTIKLEELHVKTTSYIFSQYSDLKQRSDLNDYSKFRSLATSYLGTEYENFELQIVNTVQSYFTDLTTTFDSLKQTISNPTDANGNPLIPSTDFDIIVDQLLKYFIRQEFVYRIKSLYKEYESQILNGTDYVSIYNMTFDFSSVRDIMEV